MCEPKKTPSIPDDWHTIHEKPVPLIQCVIVVFLERFSACGSDRGIVFVPSSALRDLVTLIRLADTSKAAGAVSDEPFGTTPRESPRNYP